MVRTYPTRTVGEILDASVRLYKKRVCSLIVAQLPLTLFYIGYNAFCYIGEPHSFTLFSIYGNPFYDLLMGFFFDDDLNFFRVSFLPALLYVTAVYPVTLSAVTKIASDSIVTVPSSVRRAYTFSLKHWWKLGVINIMITLAMGALIYLLLTIMFPLLSVIATSRYYNDILFFSVFIAGLLPTCFLWARLAAVYPIMVHEKNSAKH